MPIVDPSWALADRICQGDPELEKIARDALEDVPGGMRAVRAVVSAIARAYLYGLRSDPATIDEIIDREERRP
jgi:hypothetical protein